METMTPKTILFMMCMHVIFYFFGLINGVMYFKTRYRKILKKSKSDETLKQV